MSKITEEYLELAECHEELDNDLFDTDKEIEVRIPFTGYYPIKIKCKDEQSAMAYVIGATRYAGIGMFCNEPIIEDILDEETYVED